MFTKFWRYICTTNNIFEQTNWINNSSPFSALLKSLLFLQDFLTGLFEQPWILLILTNARLEYCHYIHRIEYVQLDISRASNSFVQTRTIVLYRYHLLVPQILIALHWQYCWVRPWTRASVFLSNWLQKTTLSMTCWGKGPYDWELFPYFFFWDLRQSSVHSRWTVILMVKY